MTRPYIKLIKDCIYVSVLAITATLPFSITVNSIFIILLVLLWIVYLILVKRFTASNRLYLILPLLFFLSIVISAFYSENDGLFSIEKRLVLLIFPLIFSTLPKIKTAFVDMIYATFILSTFIVTLFTFREGLTFFLSENRIWAVGELLLLHRPYLGLYCSFSIVISFFYLRPSYNSRNILIGLLIVYFVSFLYLIVAKAALFSLIAVLYLLINIHLYKKKYNFKIIALNTCVFVLILFFLIINEDLRDFLYQAISFKSLSYERYDSIVVDSFNKRFGIWRCSLATLLQNYNWAFGVGFGDITSQLNQCYEEQNLAVLLQNSFNPHNEYLHSWLGGGIFSVASLLALIIIPTITSINNSQYAFLGFILLVSICFTVESMLSVQKGVVFFALFYSLFAFSKIPDSRRGF